MKGTDPFLARIESFNKANNMNVFVHRTKGGYSLFSEKYGSPIVRLRPTGNGDEVEVLWWSHRDKWEHIGDFGGVILPLEEALEYVAEDPLGCFWI